MVSARRRLLLPFAVGLLLLTALATALVLANLLVDVTIPGLYLPIFPEIPDQQKVLLLWLPAAALVAVAARRKKKEAGARGVGARASVVSTSGDGGPPPLARHP